MKNFINNLLYSDSPTVIQGIHLINLLVIALAGKFFFDIQISWLYIIGIIISAIVIDHAFIYLRDGELKFFSISSVITAIGFAALSYSTEFYIYPLILIFALGQKYYLRVFKDKHLFNPSNVAVTLSWLLFPTISIPVFDQWGGDNFWFLVLFVTLAFYIVARVNRLAVVFSFIGSYLLVFGIYYTQIDNTMAYTEFLAKMFSGSFVIFSFFQTTDYRATTDKVLSQVIFSFITVAHIFAITYLNNFNNASMFFGLTLTMIIFPLLEKLYERFVKKDMSEKKLFWKSLIILGIYAIFVLLIVRYFSIDGLIYLKNN